MRIYFEDPIEFKNMLDKMDVAHSKNCAYIKDRKPNYQPNCNCWCAEIRKSFNLMQRMIDDDTLKHE